MFGLFYSELKSSWKLEKKVCSLSSLDESQAHGEDELKCLEGELSRVSKVFRHQKIYTIVLEGVVQKPSSKHVQLLFVSKIPPSIQIPLYFQDS